jgi:hypothetical protein
MGLLLSLTHPESDCATRVCVPPPPPPRSTFSLFEPASLTIARKEKLDLAYLYVSMRNVNVCNDDAVCLSESK